jgi:glycosyltransferase involved in cell wall biosynthesis
VSRVTFVLPCHSRKPIGGARVVYQYANGLAARGHSVTVVHAALLEPRQYLRPLALRREPKVVVRGLVDILAGPPGRPGWQWVDPRVCLRYVTTLGPDNVPDGDVVVATAWRTAESVIRYPDRKGRGFYLVQHYETWDAPPGRVDATWRSALRKIVIAEWLVEKGRALGVPDEDMVRIPNGLDHDVFRVVRPVEGRPPRVAMLYSPARVKGGADGIEALVAARRSVPDLQAVLFGVRPRPGRLPAWIDYRHNPAPKELVDDVYNGSSVYLCPSWTEGWHLPAAEAMACGCAVVSTDQGGVGNYARQGETALLSPVGDVAGLAAGIVRLCRNADERLRLAASGTRLVRTFTWERAVAAFAEQISGGASVAAGR